MKKILVISGHPNPDSFNYSLAESYKKGAEKTDCEVEILSIGELKFNPNLEYGYQKRMELEPDLIMAQKKIKLADHIVWIFPLWWGTMPAIMKGFIDRIFLPDFAFKQIDGSLISKKLLVGKTARIICTMDYPVWYYKFVMMEPGTRVLKNMILKYVGIKTIGTTYIAPVKNSKLKLRKKHLKKVEQIGWKRK
jgi:NAD(P)H dehydrogenase (quinone)